MKASGVGRVVCAFVVAGLPLAPLPAAAQPAAPTAPVTAYESLVQRVPGHWACVDAHGAHSERSYVVLHSARPGKNPPPDVYGREDGTVNGTPIASYERLRQLPSGTYTDESPDGVAEASPDPASTPLKVSFQGKNASGAPYVLSYVSNGEDSLERVVAAGGTTSSDERCAREAEPAPGACATPLAPARTIQAAVPAPPTTLPPQGHAEVRVIVVLDDRSQVMWTRVVRSDWAPFDDAALQAARDSTFRTEIRNCRPVPGEYIFTVRYARR